MDLELMLSELRQGREQVEEAIIALERLARGTGHRGGRRPKWLSAMLELNDEATSAKAARSTKGTRKPKKEAGPEAA